MKNKEEEKRKTMIIIRIYLRVDDATVPKRPPLNYRYNSSTITSQNGTQRMKESYPTTLWFIRTDRQARTDHPTTIQNKNRKKQQ